MWVSHGAQMLWTPWIIRFAAERGYTSMLASYEGLVSMSINHQEAGLNYHKKGKSTHELITSYDELFFRMPPPGVRPPKLCLLVVARH